MEPMIQDLALIMVVAAAMTLLFKRLKQPLVLGYIVAGFLVSPNMPYMSSVTDLENIHMWSDIGVMFLLFSLGLEFSFKKILKMGAGPLIAAGAIIVSMTMLGAMVGGAFGWSRMTCIFLGAMLAMSSTTIIFKAFDDMGLRQERFAGIVLSVLIIEDVLAIVMMVVLSTMAVSSEFEGATMAWSLAKLVFFIVLWFVVGIFMVPWILKKLKNLLTDETLLIFSLGLCFFMVVFANYVGFSPAFGAFVMGSILAETRQGERIEHIVAPVKNLFGAIFFVSVGMMVDVALIGQYIGPILALIATVILGQMIFGTGSYLLSGQNLRTSLRCGFSMTQIGEFAFILATLGTTLGVTEGFLYPVVVAVSVFTTFTTPYMIKFANPAATFLEKHLPKRALDFLARYSDATPEVAGEKTVARLWKPYLKEVGFNILIFGVLTVAVIVVMTRYAAPVVYGLLPGVWASVVMTAATVLLVSPFVRALMMRQSRSSAAVELWNTAHGVARAPIVAVWMVRLLIGALALGYIFAHFTAWGAVFVGPMIVVAVVAIVFSRRVSRRTQDLEAAFRAGYNEREQSAETRHPQLEGEPLERNILIAEYDIPVGVEWAGRSLRELNLGGRFHIQVVAVTRGRDHYNIPAADTLIIPGDHLQVMGTEEALSGFGRELSLSAQRGAAEAVRREMIMRRVPIHQGSALDGVTVRQSRVREDAGCIIAGVEHSGSELLTQPHADARLEAGDTLWAVGEADNLLQLATMAAASEPAPAE